MVTTQPSTVYNCAHCWAPAYFSSVHRVWFHYGAVTVCTEVSPIAVQLPAPARAGVS